MRNSIVICPFIYFYFHVLIVSMNFEYLNRGTIIDRIIFNFVMLSTPSYTNSVS